MQTKKCTGCGRDMSISVAVCPICGSSNFIMNPPTPSKQVQQPQYRVPQRPVVPRTPQPPVKKAEPSVVPNKRKPKAKTSTMAALIAGFIIVVAVAAGILYMYLPDKGYSAGEIEDGVYTNAWAGLTLSEDSGMEIDDDGKYDRDVKTYASFIENNTIDCSASDSTRQVTVCLASNPAHKSASSYFDNLHEDFDTLAAGTAIYDNAKVTYSWGDIYDIELAGQNYKYSILTLKYDGGSSDIVFAVRSKGSHAIILIGESEEGTNVSSLFDCLAAY